MAVAAEYCALFRLSDSLVQAAVPIIYFAFYLLLFILAGGSASARTALATTFHFPSTDLQTLIYVIIVTIIVQLGAASPLDFESGFQALPLAGCRECIARKLSRRFGRIYVSKLKFDVAFRVIA